MAARHIAFAPGIAAALLGAVESEIAGWLRIVFRFVHVLAAIPVPLHWFMWQSYTTWISGVLLLIATFYMNGGSALMDTSKANLEGWDAARHEIRQSGKDPLAAQPLHDVPRFIPAIDRRYIFTSAGRWRCCPNAV